MSGSALQVSRTDAGPTLVSRNVTVAGHRTSVRLEPMMWDALKEVCVREQASRSALVTEIARGRVASSLTSAIRLYLLDYFRAAANEEGHNAAGHGAVPRRGVPSFTRPYKAPDRGASPRPACSTSRGSCR